MALNYKIVIPILVAIAAILVMTIALLATSLKKLASNEMGIKYDTIQKDLGDKVYTEGLYTGPPGFEFIIFPNVYTTLKYSQIRCLNKDAVPIKIDMSFQFKAKQDKIREIVMDFKNFEGFQTVLKYTGETALHEACSYFDTSQFQAERANFQLAVSRVLKDRCNKLQADVTDLQINNIERPQEYEAAIRSKERAREDIQVAKNERPRQLTEANTTKRQAESEAQIILNKAETDARILRNKAKLEAEAILVQYEKEAEAYESIMSAAGLNFTPEGFISYIGVRLISSAKNPVFLGLESPAKTSYKTP